MPLCRLRRNDGALSLGGTPGSLAGASLLPVPHPSVVMVKEVIRLVIGEETVDADCQFTFRNTGKACTVHMGFPDEGDGERVYFPDPGTKETGPPQGQFTRFESRVNGEQVQTLAVRDKQNQSLVWHSKPVTFATGQTVVVQDKYAQQVGSQIAGHNGVYAKASYILRTGASWHSNIGSSEVLVSFRRKRPTYPLEPRVIQYGSDEYEMRDWTSEDRRVYWSGFVIPTVIDSGRTLRFYRQNWKPTNRSDVFLAFDDRGAKMSR